jgi:hypothetical protein
MWLRVLSQDRVKGTVLVRETFPDGPMSRPPRREFWVTLKIVDVEEIEEVSSE